MGNCFCKPCYVTKCCGTASVNIARLHNQSSDSTKRMNVSVVSKSFDTLSERSHTISAKSIESLTDSDLGSECLSIAYSTLTNNWEDELGLSSVSTIKDMPQERPYMCSRIDSVRSVRQVPSAMSTDSVGETLQWKKGNRLGKGTFGTVWCGLTITGELIAVKQLELDFQNMAEAEKEYEKILQEVELLKTLKHKNVVGYLGTNMEDNVVSIFMQFVPGGSLAGILTRFGPLEEAVINRYAKQILEGVQFLHSNSVIHRDIKSGNIMLMPDGVIKLIDFGCAKRITCKGGQMEMSVRGTPYWMAPEIIRGNAYGKKSDIWSIGCTVYELATGHPPWGNMDPLAAMYAIGSEDKPIPILPEEKFSPQIRSFIENCLKRNQRLRPLSSILLQHPFILLKRRRSTKKKSVHSPIAEVTVI